MTDATATRLAEERIDPKAVIYKIEKPTCGFGDRCSVMVPSRGGFRAVGQGPTWEHAFIAAGVTP